MWLFCKNGFFSAVKHNQRSGKVHVRARFKGDLERLCAAHAVKPNVVMTPDGDYRYRMDFSMFTWRRIVAAEAIRIDYTNFKDAVHDGTHRDRAYLDVWAAMSAAQREDAVHELFDATESELWRRLRVCCEKKALTADQVGEPCITITVENADRLNADFRTRIEGLQVRGRPANIIIRMKEGE